MKPDPEFSKAIRNVSAEEVKPHTYLTVCDECGEDMKTGPPVSEIGFLQIEDGMSLDLNGAYGMFTDQMGGFEEGPVDTFVHLCHDCCVTFMETFPNATRRFGLGHHPYDGDEPCCLWGWTFEYDENLDITGTRLGDGTLVEP